MADDAFPPGDAVAPPSPSGGRSKSTAKGSREGAIEGDGAVRGAGPAASSGTAWTAYTDGACSGNPGPAGLGVVLLGPRGTAHEAYEYLGTATNNIAELTAILRALEATDGAGPVTIHTDSQYAIGVLQKGWKAKANTELVARIRAALSRRRGVRLVYVPGHAGVPLNERADELARMAIRTRSSRTLPAANSGAGGVPEQGASADGAAADARTTFSEDAPSSAAQDR
jgi:ribonuclease HI